MGITTDVCYAGLQWAGAHPGISTAIAGYLSTIVFHVSIENTLMGCGVFGCGHRAAQMLRHSDIYKNTLAKQGRYLTMTKRPLLGFLTLAMLLQTCSAHKTSSNNDSGSPDRTAGVFSMWNRVYIELTSWIARAAFWGTCALTTWALATTIAIGICSVTYFYWCWGKCPVCLHDCPVVAWPDVTASVRLFGSHVRHQITTDAQALAGFFRWAASYPRRRGERTPAATVPPPVDPQDTGGPTTTTDSGVHVCMDLHTASYDPDLSQRHVLTFTTSITGQSWCYFMARKGEVATRLHQFVNDTKDEFTVHTVLADDDRTVVNDKDYIEACDYLSIRRDTRSRNNAFAKHINYPHPSGKPWRKPRWEGPRFGMNSGKPAGGSISQRLRTARSTCTPSR